MHIYHSVDDIFSDRRKGVELSEVVETLLHSPRVLAELENPFDVIEDLRDGDFIDASTTAWGRLPVELQAKYARDYQLWYSGKIWGPIPEQTIFIDNSVELELVLIPPMRFAMWSGKYNRDNWTDRPMEVHTELIDYPFWLGKYEVTKKQWFSQPDHVALYRYDAQEPMTHVNVIQANAFCRRLKMKLPNEMEWEMACRAGTTTTWYFGEDIGNLNDHAWTMNRADNFVQHVGQKLANPFGLYDMYGNVGEWCRNNRNFQETYLAKDECQVVRGGGISEGPGMSSSSARYFFPRQSPHYATGFRVMKKA